MYDDDEHERKILYELGLTVNWNCISNDEWERMLKRNELSKQLEDKDKQAIKTNDEE